MWVQGPEVKYLSTNVIQVDSRYLKVRWKAYSKKVQTHWKTDLKFDPELSGYWCNKHTIELHKLQEQDCKSTKLPTATASSQLRTPDLANTTRTWLKDNKETGMCPAALAAGRVRPRPRPPKSPGGWSISSTYRSAREWKIGSGGSRRGRGTRSLTASTAPYAYSAATAAAQDSAAQPPTTARGWPKSRVDHGRNISRDHSSAEITRVDPSTPVMFWLVNTI